MFVENWERTDRLHKNGWGRLPGQSRGKRRDGRAAHDDALCDRQGSAFASALPDPVALHFGKGREEAEYCPHLARRIECAHLGQA